MIILKMCCGIWYIYVANSGREQPIRVRIDEPTSAVKTQGQSVRFVCTASGSNTVSHFFALMVRLKVAKYQYKSQDSYEGQQINRGSHTVTFV